MHTPHHHFDHFLMCSNWLSWSAICSSIQITGLILFINSDLFVISTLANYPGFMHGCIDLIGVMRWMIKIGHVNINTKVFLLSSHSACQDRGIQRQHYISWFAWSSLVFDPSYPKIDHSNLQECNWTYFWGFCRSYPTQNTIAKRERGGSMYAYRQPSCWQQTD